MRRLIGLLLIAGSIALAFPAAALAQGTCWLAEDEFVDTRVGELEEPGYIVSVEGRDYERCWANVRLLTAPGEAFSGYTKMFYVDELEPLMLVPDTARAFGCPYGVDDEVDMLATGPDWNAVEQTGDGWVPARIAGRRQELPLRRRRVRRRCSGDLQPAARSASTGPAAAPDRGGNREPGERRCGGDHLCARRSPSMPTRLKISGA